MFLPCCEFLPHHCLGSFGLTYVILSGTCISTALDEVQAAEQALAAKLTLTAKEALAAKEIVAVEEAKAAKDAKLVKQTVTADEASGTITHKQAKLQGNYCCQGG